jgi:hypothetical protein
MWETVLSLFITLLCHTVPCQALNDRWTLKIEGRDLGDNYVVWKPVIRVTMSLVSGHQTQMSSSIRKLFKANKALTSNGGDYAAETSFISLIHLSNTLQTVWKGSVAVGEQCDDDLWGKINGWEWMSIVKWFARWSNAVIYCKCVRRLL